MAIRYPLKTDGTDVKYNNGTGETNLDLITNIGGLYGANFEALTGNKTLTPGTDEIYQHLDANGSNRVITLDTASASAGDRFVIRHGYTALISDSQRLQINQVTAIDYIYVGEVKYFIYDGTNWVANDGGTGESGDLDQSVGYGYSTNAYNKGTSVGWAATSYAFGVAIGNQANGSNNGVAVGYLADGRSNGVALGQGTDTNGKYYSVALGYYSETERYGEISHNIDGQTDQENNIILGGWSLETTTNTPTIMLVAGTSGQYFTIRALSSLSFKLIITAYDNTANHMGMWTVENGAIKRDGSSNTTLLSATVNEIQNESTDWAVTVTADDTNEALEIKATGDPTNRVQWAARLDGVETHF